MNQLSKRVAIAFIAVTVMAVVAYAPISALAGAGEDLYKSKCAMCHGADGTGDTAMGKKLNIRNLKSPEVQKETDAQLTEIITKGKNKMPEYGSKLKPEEIKQVVAAIRAMK